MSDREVVARAAAAITDRAVEAARVLTDGGARTDDYQVVVDRVAYAATEARVIAELAKLPDSLAPIADVAIAELAAAIPHRLAPVEPLLKLGRVQYEGDAERAISRDLAPPAVEAIGAAAIVAGGKPTWPLDEVLEEVRSNVRTFAEREIAPNAERIHHHDELVPERTITEMAKLGYFGLSIPESYGGHELGNLAMILTTEELSRA
jgi:(2S)-methylsuccinyl-CoA dehydrogenase